jgi:mannose-1-phosphate guanylyltransferase
MENTLKNIDFVAVIMAGGAGTRFWPLSTTQKPKQFLSIFGDRSLLRMSYDRLAEIIPPERILVLTSRDFVSLTESQLPMIPRCNIIGEPKRRDTAAAVALSAYLCRVRFGNPVIATVTADHLIEPEQVFRETLLSAVKAASSNTALYTFGITPTHPATAYGYLERGDMVLDDNGIRHYNLLRFKEKPDIETARRYVASDKFRWNSGMFVWRTDAIITQIEQHLPGHACVFEKAAAADGTAEWQNALECAFADIPAVSIDYGIMEHAPEVRCVDAGFSWTDVGSWHALCEHLPADNQGNYHRGELVTLDSKDNIVYCDDPGDTVMTVGVHDLVIVRAGSQTLIAHKDRVDEIKQLVTRQIPCQSADNTSTAHSSGQPYFAQVEGSSTKPATKSDNQK